MFVCAFAFSHSTIAAATMRSRKNAVWDLKDLCYVATIGRAM